MNADDRSSDHEAASASTRRGRRRKPVKAGAISALEKIRRGRESGVLEEDAVETPSALFDYVDDAEYGRIVQQRQHEAFVMDDDGSYADHGREVFDEEVTPKTKIAKTVRKRPAASSIKAMLMSRSSSKPKEEKPSLANDELLSELLLEAEHNPGVKARRSKQRVSTFAPRIKDIESTNKRLSVTNTEEYRHVTNKPATSCGVSNEPESTNESADYLPDEQEPCSNQPESAYDITKSTNDITEVTDPTTAMEGDDITREGDDITRDEESAMVSGSVQCDWEQARTGLVQPSVPKLEIDASATVGGEDELLFYWLDAFEDPYHQPGTVFLFGKTRRDSSFISCCVVVKNIERCLYFLPRETLLDKHSKSTEQPVTFEDLYNEFTEKYADPFRLSKFTSKRIAKKYAFEKEDVPSECEYLEVRYSADFPAPQTSATGRSFSRVFGTTTSSLERLILKCGLKGPCWLLIKNPEIPSMCISWCKHEVNTSAMDDVVVATTQAPPPPIVTCSLSVVTYTHPKAACTQVLCIGALLNSGVSLDKPPPHKHDVFQEEFCVISHPVDRDYPFGFRQLLAQKGFVVEVVPSERALLAFFLAKLHKLDPDVLVGHNLSSFLLEVLHSRLSVCKVPQWSRIGRLKRKELGKRRWAGQAMCAGRPVCDVKVCAMELMKARSYDLSELASAVLGVRHVAMKQEDILGTFCSKETLSQLISCTMNESFLTLRILFELNMLPLAYQITSIAGNTLSRTLLGGRAERNEFLLLHAFTAKGFICPDKIPASKRIQSSEEETTRGRHKPTYAGGLVLEPKKGFYDHYILLLDFNSLYPSIIQEYNICFTTVDHCSAEDYSSLVLPSSSQALGVLPTEIRVLVERRRKVKQLMKLEGDPQLLQQYDIRQKALKLTANSMYGCLGFYNSRFYAKPLAALITSKGREILLHTKELAEKLNFDVIYGDTDSIMIDSKTRNYQEAEQIAQRIKTEVNKFYRLLEIDVDGIYKCMLLLRKKKYAAVAVVKQGDRLVEQRELKGLDVVRRDWSNLAKNSGLFVLNQLLSGAQIDDVISEVQTHLIRVKEDVTAGRVALEQFVITKSLTKPPSDYPDKKGLPHVQVALRQLSKGVHVQAGDVVPYVMCQGDGSQALKAFHPDEVAKLSHLQVDTHYYLQHQLHAVVSRLCEPIQGLDAAHIALWLGLDSSAYVSTDLEEPAEGDKQVDDFDDLPPLYITCQSCKQQMLYSEGACPACDKTPTNTWLLNQLTLICRAYIARYYAGWLVCEDHSCSYRTRGLSQAGCPNCRHGKLMEEYPAVVLYRQLASFDHLLSLKGGHESVSAHVKVLVEQNHYSKISLATLFP